MAAMVSLPSDSARLRFQVLRRDCGLADEKAGNEIWTEYDTLKNKFAMEGDPIHWLACGTYVHILEHSLHADIIHLLKASKMNVPVFFFKLKRMLDIVGKTSKYKNHVAALEDEFNVAKVIFDKLDQLFVDILEQNGNENNDISPNGSVSRPPKTMRASNRNLINPNINNSNSNSDGAAEGCPLSLPDVFHFVWVMFIWLKQHEQCGALKDDLLNCFHMLVCCFDCVITELFQHDKLNVFLRHDLLKDDALLRNIESGVGIISWLCTRHVAISDEAMLIQSKWLMPLLEEEIDAGRLQADVEEIDIGSGPNNVTNRRILRNFLFPVARFQHNLNFFSTSYAKTTHASNAFDERALLLSGSSKNVVINGEMDSTWIAYNMHQRHDVIRHSILNTFPTDSYRTPPASPPLEHMVSVTPSSRRASMFEKTPLTAKGQLPNRNQNREKNEMSGTYTNVTSVLLRVRELVALLQNRTNRASPKLLDILRQYDMLDDVERELTERLRDLGNQFLTAYENDASHMQQQNQSQRLGAVTTMTVGGSTVREPTAKTSVIKTFARRRLALTQILFWKLVEALVVHELRRCNGAKPAADDSISSADPSKALQYLRQDQFARNLVALCLETVLFCHQSNKKFPWTLSIFQISAFDFGLFTEFIIRAEPCLPRDVLRHLHRIEEQVYEELIWRDDSKLWPLIDKTIETNGRVPSFEDVAGRNQLDDGTGPFSPYRHARIQAIKRYMRKHSADSKLNAARNLLSASVQRVKYCGPGRPPKRLLENGDAATPNDAEVQTTTTNKAARGSLAFEFDSISSIPYDKFAVVNGNVMLTGETTRRNELMTKSQPTSPPRTNNKPDQLSPNSSSPANQNTITALNLVLRKVYSIMAVRLRDLCDRLDIISTDVRQYAQLWSALDLIFRSILPVLKNRHLDQLILCTIYVLGRLRLIQDKTFQDILTAYRAQPQASSVVYRQVYIGDQEFMNGDGTKTILEERADIINFYNAVFLKQIQPHVVALREQVHSMASPLPKIATRASSFSASKLGPNVYCSIIPSISSTTSSMTDIVNNNSFGTHGSVINYNPNSSNMPSSSQAPSTWSAGSGNNNNSNSFNNKSRNNPLVQSPHRIVVHSGSRLNRGIGSKPEIRQLNRALDLASLTAPSVSVTQASPIRQSAPQPIPPPTARPATTTAAATAVGSIVAPLRKTVGDGVRTRALPTNNNMPSNPLPPSAVPIAGPAGERQKTIQQLPILTNSSTQRPPQQPTTRTFVDAARANSNPSGAIIHLTRPQQPRVSTAFSKKTMTLADIMGKRTASQVAAASSSHSPAASQPLSAIAESQRENQSSSPVRVNDSPPSSTNISSGQGGDEEEEDDDELMILDDDDEDDDDNDNNDVDNDDDESKSPGMRVFVTAQTTTQFGSQQPSQSSAHEPQPATDSAMQLEHATLDEPSSNPDTAEARNSTVKASTTKQFGESVASPPNTN